MAVELVMPKLAMAMQQGTVLEWTVMEGAQVVQGQTVLTIETEKVNFDCESPADGFIHILIEPGTMVPVYEKLAFIAENEAELLDLQRGANPPAVEVSKISMPSSNSSTSGSTAENVANSNTKKTTKISPLAQKIAKQYNLDVGKIIGSGPGGRVLKEDVEKALADWVADPKPIPTETPVEIIDGKRVKSTMPMKGMRKAIADHMVSSLATSAQLSGSCEIDMTQMIRLRTALLEKEKEIGVRISYSDLIILALIKAVKHVPLVNSSLIGEEIKIWEDINVSIAVAVGGGDTAGGLVAPVLKKCGGKSLAEISAGVKELSARARSRALTPDDLAGGTITISSVGMFGLGWTVSTPILNKPQTMIVQPGEIFEKPVVEHGQIKIRSVMTVCITFDHRIIDGWPAGRFVGKLKELCEKPDYLHL